jgi:small-conductance mechanosensitive channel
MPRLFKTRNTRSLDRMFETRSEAWAAVGLEVEINRHQVQVAVRRLPLEVLGLAAVIVGEGIALRHINGTRTGGTVTVGRFVKHLTVHGGLPRETETPIKLVAIILVITLGWLMSRDLAKAAPALFRRMDPATAGTVEFLIRFLAVAATLLGALAVAGISLQAIAVGGAFTAIVLGLAAQQTLGNLFAGMVLLSARPFRLGERVRFQAGALAGGAEGVVASLGLLYTTLSRGEERIMIPNNLVLSAAILPLREPEAVDVRVTLHSAIRPSHVQAILDSNVSTPTRKAPSVHLEEINGNSVVMRVQAMPERHSDGARLADEIISALVSVTGQHADVDAGAPRS